MKYKLRLVCIFLIVLMSIALFGCSKTGEKMVESSLKRRINYEKIEYVYHSKNHVGRITIKTTDRLGNPCIENRYYNVLSDDNVIQIKTHDIPNYFLDLLYTQYPEDFIQDVATYRRLTRLQNGVTEVLDFLGSSLSSGNSIEGQPKFANIVIDLYAEEYRGASDVVASEFPEPIEPFPLSIYPSVYIDYFDNCSPAWHAAVRDKSLKMEYNKMKYKIK